MSDLGCSCSIDACDLGVVAECFSEKMVKARKEHKCCECGETIKKGETHEVASALWDGDWGTYRTCAICRTIRNAYCCTWYYGGLRETLWEYLELDYITGETINGEDDDGPGRRSS